MTHTPNSNGSSRRTFLKQSTAAMVGGTLAATMAGARSAHAAGSDTLKVGLVGCGGRGMGAANNAMAADENVQLTALADLFADKVEEARTQLSKQVGSKYQVPEDHCFAGFDAYKQLLETDVDVVLLCTTPHYRPVQLRAAVEAGKHIFCEKPVAVDPVGVRSVLDTSELAAKKGRNLVSGLCWRYDHGVRATIGKILDGAIGDITAIHENYLTGTLWYRQPKPDWTQMEDQNRNWYYYTWLSGDHIVEQFIHSLDKALWLMGDNPPLKCFGLGGRQVRTEAKWGNIYDHHSVCYEWPNGVKTFAYTRQMKAVFTQVEDFIVGTKGHAEVLAHSINGERVFPRKKPNMYLVEHEELFQAIRKGEAINNGKYMSYSTMLAIMGREACYTGQEITWEQAMNSQQRLGPTEYKWGDVEAQPVAMPGVTRFA
jgi:myo-inositol 2-dehydrogenase/D-chiro-inositol 1-dehydrogenase